MNQPVFIIDSAKASVFWQISQQRNEKIEDMKTTITGIRSGGQSGADAAGGAGGIELCVGGQNANIRKL